MVALDRMQWVFDGKGLFTRNARGRAYLKEQFIRMLQTQEGKDALQVLVDNEKLKSLVPVDVVINDVSDFINYLSRDDVFNKIFK